MTTIGKLLNYPKYRSPTLKFKKLCNFTENLRLNIRIIFKYRNLSLGSSLLVFFCFFQEKYVDSTRLNTDYFIGYLRT